MKAIAIVKALTFSELLSIGIVVTAPMAIVYAVLF
jgi:hypothetical protein